MFGFGSGQVDPSVFRLVAVVCYCWPAGASSATPADRGANLACFLRGAHHSRSSSTVRVGSSAFFALNRLDHAKGSVKKRRIAPRLSVPQCVTRGFWRESLQRGTTLLDEIPGFTGGSSGGGGVGNGALLLCCSGFRVEARRRHTRGYDGGGASSLCAFCDSVGCCVAEAQRCCCRPVVGTSCAARPHLKAREHEAADAPTRRTGPVVFGRRRRKT